MLFDLDAFRSLSGRTYTPDDITVVIAVRAHQKNPWVLERVAALGGYYEPAPRILIVDFGSQQPYRSQLRECCERAGFEAVYVDDTGVYCPAKARNVGAAHAKTDLLFFSDADCFGERDLFARLIAAANALEVGATFDQFLVLPVYHLGAESSAAFFAAPSHEQRAAHLTRSFCRGVHTPFGMYEDYVDPQSNFLLIRRDFFDYVGGMNEHFRGHGSEDFELLLRLAMYSRQYPLPDNLGSDLYGPMRKDFFGPRPYRGFRRLFELMAQQAELAGLRIAHLYHERALNDTGWYEHNDWRRSRFTEQIEPYLHSRSALLNYDWMPRAKTALVLIKQADHADLLFPLRLAGFKLLPVRSAEPESLARATQMIEAGSVDAVAIMNPYMKSHVDLRGVFETARRRGIRTIVIERGALPDSWYYASDMSYADPEFAGLDLASLELSERERSLADAYVERLCTGVSTLEANGSFEETRARRGEYRRTYQRICLVPLQIDDDTAVTQFNAGYQPYATFVEQVLEEAGHHPDVLFLIKPHPLSTRRIEPKTSNVIACHEGDHIHALIELSDAVICYNSGVGLLALVHGKRLATIGNAFYNLPGLGVRTPTFAAAVSAVFAANPEAFHSASVRDLIAWLVFRKYSFFRGESVIREFGTRKAHAYRNLLWYQLNLDGARSTLRAALSAPVHAQCYATARAGIGRELARRQALASGELGEEAPGARGASPGVAAVNKLRKLVRNPRNFLVDSQYAPLRWVGEHWPAERSLGRMG